MCRCVACDSILPAVRVTKQLLQPHPTDPDKKEVITIEDDLCRKCSNVSSSSNFYLSQGSNESEDLSDLGLELPSPINYDY